MTIKYQRKTYLSSLVQLGEILEALNSIHDAKRPGPDGYTSKKFKLHWDQIKEEPFLVGSEIFQTGQLARGLNHTFLTVIPKKKKTPALFDYNPIACDNVLFKLVAKILCNRFKSFLPFFRKSVCIKY